MYYLNLHASEAGAFAAHREIIEMSQLPKYDSVRYVDNVGSNFLMRGPEPTIAKPDGSAYYDYDGLTTAIESAILAQSTRLPSTPRVSPWNYFLVHINLLHPTEVSEISA